MTLLCTVRQPFRLSSNRSLVKMMSSDVAAFQKAFQKANNVVVMSGAGISAESGVPTFRGAGGLWRKFSATELATPEAFDSSPSLVWEFYHHRREFAAKCNPNPGHIAVTEAQSRLAAEGRKLTVITQNIDELHIRAGSKDVIEMHGTLYKTRCTKCKTVEENHDSPICPALAGRGAPDPTANNDPIPVRDLPACKKAGCGGLLRPHIVWFGEMLQQDVLDRIDIELQKCDFFIVVGTSGVVYPAAGYAMTMASKGIPVAEFNIEKTMGSSVATFLFLGPSGQWLPKTLAAASP